MSTSAACMCLTDRLSDCDGHLSADALFHNKRPGTVREPRRRAGHGWHCPFSNIFLGGQMVLSFSPHVSFLPPSTIPALPPQRAGTSFVPRRFIKASFKTAQMKREEA